MGLPYRGHVSQEAFTRRRPPVSEGAGWWATRTSPFIHRGRMNLAAGKVWPKAPGHLGAGRAELCSPELVNSCLYLTESRLGAQPPVAISTRVPRVSTVDQGSLCGWSYQGLCVLVPAEPAEGTAAAASPSLGRDPRTLGMGLGCSRGAGAVLSPSSWRTPIALHLP